MDSEENKSWGQCTSNVEKSMVWGGCWRLPVAICRFLGKADESTWVAGENWQWQLNLVILREEKRRKLRKWKYNEARYCYLKQIPCSHSMRPATADWFIPARLRWLRSRAEVNQTKCNSKYKLQKTQISSFSEGSCPPFSAWKRVINPFNSGAAVFLWHTRIQVSLVSTDKIGFIGG